VAEIIDRNYVNPGDSVMSAPADKSRAEFDTAESWIPSGREIFPLYELAELFCCSVQHLWNLAEERAIIVPQENIDRAKSRSLFRSRAQALLISSGAEARWNGGRKAGNG
jgi:hypothetical protein